MKKTYINPAMEIVMVQTQQMLASSPDAKFDPMSETSSMEGRSYDFDDEEEY